MKIVNFFTNIPKFLKEVVEELKKSSWSTREELISATIVVLAGSFFLTVFIYISDNVLARMLQILIK